MKTDRADAITDVDTEIERLRVQVADLRDLLERAGRGGIDAVVLGPPGAEQVYSLSSAERPYRLIVEHMTEGAATVSQHGTILFVNRRMGELLGRPPAEIVGTAAETLVAPDDRAALGRMLEVGLGDVARSEVTLAAPDPVPVALSAACMRMDDSLVRCLIATDITPQKQAERMLAARVEEKTRELAATNRELESFAYSVAHDLRAPLRSIDGFSQVLVEDLGPKLDPEALGHLQRVRASAQQMGVLIDDLLTLARVAQGDLSVESIDLSALARRVVTELRESDPHRRVTVRIESGLSVDADRRLAEVVLRNLLGNAWKFTGRTAHPTIRLGAAETRPWIFVADNGAGFDMAHADRLFQAFQRLHTTSAFPGTGIGLATVARILNRHGGAIRASAAPGQGAVFTFTFAPDPRNSFAPADEPLHQHDPPRRTMGE